MDLLPSLTQSTHSSEEVTWVDGAEDGEDYPTDEALAAVALFEDYPEYLLTFAAGCCMLFMLLGIPGNLITIIALARCKKVRNATAVFIINLSCSDLLFCCFNLPLAASTFWQRSWTHGRILCRMFPFARYALVAVSLFTILAITINRYVMISHPRFYPKMYRGYFLAIMVASTWIFAFGALIATWMEVWGRFGLDIEIGSCTILRDHNNKSPKEFLFVGAFMLPCLAILICYARIFIIVREAERRSRGPLTRQATNMDDSAMGSASTAFDRSPGLNNERGIAPNKNLLSPPNFMGAVTAAPERSSSSGVDTMDGQDEERPGAATELKPRSNSCVETARRLRNAACALSRRSPAPTRPPRLTPKDRKLLRMIMAIMLSFWVCYLPITLTKIFREFTLNPFANIAGYLLIYMTTCINPIIYVVMSSEYRQAYKNLLMCAKSA